MNKVIECQTHNKIYKNICKECNVLLCEICVVKHSRSHRDHSCYHIDEIKESLNNLDNTINNDIQNNLENNNSDDTTEDYLQEELIKIWNSIKSSSSDLNTLELKENEISNHFKQFHEYLIIEEHRLKSKIVNDIESIKQQTKHQINQLKSIINIINLNNNSNSNNKQNNNVKIKYEADQEDQEEEIDKSSQHSIETIIKTIQESTTLNQFLKRNNKTIFNQQHNHHNQDLLNSLNNDINLSILESIHNHKKLYNDNINTQQNEYTITIDNQSIDNAKQSINKSIELTTKIKDYNQQIKSSIPSISSPKGIILSTNKDGKIATLFDTNKNNKVIDQIDFNHNTEGTFNSIVNTGEYVYIFGGYDSQYISQFKYIGYSIKEQRINHKGMHDIDLGSQVSACFDGNEYIYLFGGAYHYIFSPRRIYRFNIKTMKFENLCNYNSYITTIVHSFYYEYVLYFIPSNYTKIYIFDPITKDLTFHENNDLFSDSRSACSDGNGNIYILSEKKQFIRYSIKSKKVDKLSSIISLDVPFQSMVYVHSGDDKSSRIYIFGERSVLDKEKIERNFIYNIDKNQWSSFNSEDSYIRLGCPSILL